MDSSEQKPSRLLVPFLLLVIAGLVVLNFYQNNVIRDQRVELRWLLSHKIEGVNVPAKPANGPAVADPASPADPAGKAAGHPAPQPPPNSK